MLKVELGREQVRPRYSIFNLTYELTLPYPSEALTNGLNHFGLASISLLSLFYVRFSLRKVPTNTSEMIGFSIAVENAGLLQSSSSRIHAGHPVEKGKYEGRRDLSANGVGQGQICRCKLSAGDGMVWPVVQLQFARGGRPGRA